MAELANAPTIIALASHFICLHSPMKVVAAIEPEIIRASLRCWRRRGWVCAVAELAPMAKYVLRLLRCRIIVRAETRMANEWDAAQFAGAAMRARGMDSPEVRSVPELWRRTGLGPAQTQVDAPSR
jgi:hypothetical protein